MGKLAEMQRKLLEVRLGSFTTELKVLTQLAANDGPGSHGSRECQLELEGRESLQKLPLRDMSTCSVHKHGELTVRLLASKWLGG